MIPILQISISCLWIVKGKVGTCCCFLNPLIPNVNVQILLTDVHIVLIVLFGRRCLNIKTSHLW